MATPDPVLPKRYLRSSKFDPFVDEVELIEANPRYSHVRFPDGHDTLSNKRLAPAGDIGEPLTICEQRLNESVNTDEPEQLNENRDVDEQEPELTPLLSPNKQIEPSTSHNAAHETTTRRRSSRIRRSPDRLTYY